MNYTYYTYFVPQPCQINYRQPAAIARGTNRIVNKYLVIRMVLGQHIYMYSLYVHICTFVYILSKLTFVWSRIPYHRRWPSSREPWTIRPEDMRRLYSTSSATKINKYNHITNKVDTIPRVGDINQILKSKYSIQSLVCQSGCKSCFTIEEPLWQGCWQRRAYAWD